MADVEIMKIFKVGFRWHVGKAQHVVACFMATILNGSKCAFCDKGSYICC